MSAARPRLFIPDARVDAEARRRWLALFCRIYRRRTGAAYNPAAHALPPARFIAAGYLPESAVYQLTGRGVEHV
jgi:hypothetical protein